MPENLTPAEVAEQLAVSTDTVQELTVAYADSLSGGAVPQEGDQRHYTQADVAVLATILELRSASWGEEEIRTALASGALPVPDRAAEPSSLSSIPPANLSTLPPEVAEAFVAIARHLEVLAQRPEPREGSAELANAMEALARRQGDTDSLNARLDALQARIDMQSTAMRRLGFIWGVLLGVVIVLILALFAGLV